MGLHLFCIWVIHGTVCNVGEELVTVLRKILKNSFNCIWMLALKNLYWWDCCIWFSNWTSLHDVLGKIHTQIWLKIAHGHQLPNWIKVFRSSGWKRQTIRIAKTRCQITQSSQVKNTVLIFSYILFFNIFNFNLFYISTLKKISNLQINLKVIKINAFFIYFLPLSNNFFTFVSFKFLSCNQVFYLL